MENDIFAKFEKYNNLSIFVILLFEISANFFWNFRMVLGERSTCGMMICLRILNQDLLLLNKT